jgi:microcystin-dependent protein
MMAEPFLGQISIFGFNWAPRGFALCDGQLLPISQYQSLYSLLGTTFGGDGRTNFGLPNLKARVPIHFDSTYREGQVGGEETHTLTVQEIPAHTHAVQASSTTADAPIPGTTVLANANNVYHSPDSALLPLRTGSVQEAGGSQGHDNMQPYLVLNFCIALQGLYPPRN